MEADPVSGTLWDFFWPEVMNCAPNTDKVYYKTPPSECSKTEYSIYVLKYRYASTWLVHGMFCNAETGKTIYRWNYVDRRCTK